MAFTHVDFEGTADRYAAAREGGHHVVRVPDDNLRHTHRGTCPACNPPRTDPDVDWKIANLLDNMKRVKAAHNRVLAEMSAELDALLRERGDVADAPRAVAETRAPQ